MSFNLRCNSTQWFVATFQSEAIKLSSIWKWWTRSGQILVFVGSRCLLTAWSAFKKDALQFKVCMVEKGTVTNSIWPSPVELWTKLMNTCCVQLFTGEGHKLCKCDTRLCLFLRRNARVRTFDVIGEYTTLAVSWTLGPLICCSSLSRNELSQLLNSNSF